MQDFQICDMTEGDVAFAASLEQECFAHPWDIGEWERCCRNDTWVCLVARWQNEVAGCCCASLSYETADLCRIAVDQSFRRRGVAGMLLEELVRRCRERQVETILLEVRRSNDIAVSFYNKKNFQMLHTRKNYYNNPVEDAFVMQLVL